MISVAAPTMSLPPFTSQLIADVGISLGDEGKGRLIPEIADELRGTPAAVTKSMGEPIRATRSPARNSICCPAV